MFKVLNAFAILSLLISLSFQARKDIKKVEYSAPFRHIFLIYDITFNLTKMIFEVVVFIIVKLNEPIFTVCPSFGKF